MIRFFLCLTILVALPSLAFGQDEKRDKKENKDVEKTTSEKTKTQTSRWTGAEVAADLFFCPHTGRLLARPKRETLFPSKRSIVYRYDSEGRLVTKDYRDKRQLTIKFEYNQGKISQEKWRTSYFQTATTFTYSTEGHLIKSISKGSFEAVKFYFYEQRRLVRSVQTRSDSCEIREYSYDGKTGRRTGKTVRILLLDEGGKVKYKKTSRWTYQWDKDRLVGATIVQTYRHQNEKSESIGGKMEIKYTTDNQLSTMTTYYKNQKYREVKFIDTETKSEK